MKINIVKPYYLPLILLIVFGCSKGQEKQPSPQIHYQVGQPYQLGDVWCYPEETFSYKATGIAIISGKKKGEMTADGELYNPDAMTAAHPTLQLPAIVIVHNLDNGRIIKVRLNDRGNALPARMLELTPKAATLLGMIQGQPARIEMVENEAESQALAYQMPNGPQTQFKVNAAPLSTIKVENLDGSKNITSEKKNVALSVNGQSDNERISLPDLPAIYQQGQVENRQLWIDVGTFTSHIYANRLAARTGGIPVYRHEGGRAIIHVRLGPYQSVENADSNLDYLLKSGIKGARIIVE